VAREEILVLNGEGRREQVADVDGGAAREEDAVRVGEEDLAVGGEAAVDFGRIAPRDAVERDGGGARLAEVDPGARADREGLPVENRGARALRDLHVRAGARDARGTRRYC